MSIVRLVAGQGGLNQNWGAAAARIGALLADAQRQLESGRWAEAIAVQRQAAGEARELGARFPDDAALRQSVASVLYNWHRCWFPAVITLRPCLSSMNAWLSMSRCEAP